MALMRYRFKIPYRQFRPGDLVPAGWDSGTVRTMLEAHRIAPVAEPAQAKAIEAPPADKMLRPARVSTKRKGDQ